MDIHFNSSRWLFLLFSRYSILDQEGWTRTPDEGFGPDEERKPPAPVGPKREARIHGRGTACGRARHDLDSGAVAEGCGKGTAIGTEADCVSRWEVSCIMSNRLVGIRAKIERAKHHIRDLESRISAFRETDPYRFIGDEDQQTGERVYRSDVRAEPPVEFAIVAGEALHQLRSTLDHLAWQLVEANGEKPGTKTAFPVFQSLPDYEAQSARKVKGMSDGAKDLVKAVQPFQTGFAPLGILAELNNFDKHRLLFVVAFGIQNLRMTMRAANPLMDDPRIQAMLKDFFESTPMREAAPAPTRMFSMRCNRPGAPGGVVFRMAWPDGPPQNNEDVQLTFDIAFAEPEIVRGHAILPLLTQLSQFTERMIDQFAPLL